jgi:hypothetical protein
MSRTLISPISDINKLRIELAYRIPERFVSLALAGTTAGFPLCNIPPVRWVQTFPTQRMLSKGESSGLDFGTC